VGTREISKDVLRVRRSLRREVARLEGPVLTRTIWKQLSASPEKGGRPHGYEEILRIDFEF